ncbi:TPA: spore coat protein [Legionella pneumophila]|nr:spore coat protein [Legionella pneumophila]HAT9884436.1 spore coat protein [Legionella pneumophila subsp. pneumophila]HAT2067240.1 spore coat protein [Legionella pneumophila]HAT8594048.1 spore coat protein [Legionella pneumophila]HAT8696832.1 spore coat protein [Legionella pneumophila]
MVVKSFHLGPFIIGKEYPPVFLAEIGTFFNKDIRLAENLLKKIIEVRSSVPYQPLICKTEILNNPEICLRGDYQEIYSSKDGEVKKENYRSLIERKSLSLQEYEFLFSLLREVNLPFIVSIYESDVVDFAIKQGACALKTSSSNIVNIPLIRHLARTGLPLIIDTGRSNLSEIFNAVEAARQEGCNKIIVEHSPDGHPALPEAHNLRMLKTFEQCFGSPVGLSDHYNGVEMLYPSIALGASLLEKGVHFFPNALDQDISHTMDINQLPGVLRSIYDCWLALGENIRDMRAPIKGVIGSSQRNCIVAKNNLFPGDLITLDNTKFAFPCKGIPVQYWDLVVGWNIKNEIKAGSPITWSDIHKLEC